MSYNEDNKKLKNVVNSQEDNFNNAHKDQNATGMKYVPS